MLFLGVARATVPKQSAAMLPMARATIPPIGPLFRVSLLSHGRPYPDTYMAPPAWPMYMPSYLPRPQMEPSSTQSEREQLAIQRQELEVKELEVKRRTQALNLNTIRDAETRSAAPFVRSSWIRPSEEQTPIKPKRNASSLKEVWGHSKG